MRSDILWNVYYAADEYQDERVKNKTVTQIIGHFFDIPCSVKILFL